MNRKILERSLLKTWNWFTRSGVMLPADGSWGVAERVMLTEGNEAKENTRAQMPWMRKKRTQKGAFARCKKPGGRSKSGFHRKEVRTRRIYLPACRLSKEGGQEQTTFTQSKL